MDLLLLNVGTPTLVASGGSDLDRFKFALLSRDFTNGLVLGKKPSSACGRIHCGERLTLVNGIMRIDRCTFILFGFFLGFLLNGIAFHAWSVGSMSGVACSFRGVI